MCNWSINWGDVPTWLGAIGAVGALFWAVFLYARSLRDGRKAQARLLAPIGGAVSTQVLPGTKVTEESASTTGAIWEFVPNFGPVVVKESYTATVRLVSTSNETFSGIRVWLVLADGELVDFPFSIGEMAPHSESTHTVYYAPDVIGGVMKVRVHFQDANGRWWERLNGQPVRELRPREHPREEEPRASTGSWKTIKS